MDSVFEKLTEQISAYEIMNHIVPGGVYIILADRLTSFSLLTDRVLANIVLFYFAGVVLGRIGSLLLEGLMERIQNNKCWFYLNRTSYGDYVQAEEKDKEHRLHQLVMINNMFRALAAASLLLFATILFDWGISFFPTGILFRRITILIACLLLLCLFLFSFRKQTGYIRARVERLNESTPDAENKRQDNGK